MSTVKQEEPASQAAAHDFTQCPFWGQGGQYVFDPATGRRTRAGELSTAPGVPAATGETTTNIAKKEKTRG